MSALSDLSQSFNLQKYSGIVNYGLWGLAIIALITGVALWLRNKRIYKFKVVIYSRRGEGDRTVRVGKGGFIKKDNLVTFRIKWGLIGTKWNRKDLEINPDTNYIYGNTIYYDQYDPTTYIQLRKFFLKTKTRIRKVRFLEDYQGYHKGEEIRQWEHLIAPLIINNVVEYVGEGGDYQDINEEHLEPVPRESKVLAVQEINSVGKVLLTDTFKTTLTIGGLIVLGVTLIATIFLLIGD